jgi:3-hydroxybutyryl-CoA dehydrogenase
MDFQTIGVIGVGVMGGGIAQMFAEQGINILVLDVDAGARDRGIANIEKRLGRSAEKGSITPERASEIMSHIGRAECLEDLDSANLVIEAIIENEEAKREFLSALSGIMADTAVIGTNTSSLSITSLASACHRAERFLGIHFFNPPTKVELVEVIPTAQTSPEVLQGVRSLLEKCGRTPVVVKDSPGFIVNRLLLLMINEAARMIDQGVATPEEIDTAMKLGALHPVGPLALADLIGLDTCTSILRVLQQELGGSSYEPAEAIVNLMRLGRLGRKSGEGFYKQK